MFAEDFVAVNEEDELFNQVTQYLFVDVDLDGTVATVVLDADRERLDSLSLQQLRGRQGAGDERPAACHRVLRPECIEDRDLQHPADGLGAVEPGDVIGAGEGLLATSA